MNRSAPKAGYDFGNKRQYRRNVWAWAARFVKYNRGTTDVALMPSAEGDEIEVALAKGFKDHRLHVIDKNAAIVATLKRRFPRINTYGVDVIEAFERMSRNGVEIKFANLDLCGTVVATVPILERIAAMVEPFANPHAFAITVFRGREKNLESFSQHIFGRSGKVCALCGDECEHGYEPVTAADRIEEAIEDGIALSKLDIIRSELLFDTLIPDSHWDSLSADHPRIYRSSSNTTMMYRFIKRANKRNGGPVL